MTIIIMIDPKKCPNTFGECLAPISEIDFKMRVAMLQEIFLSMLEKHTEISAYFESMLKEMNSEVKITLFIKLARWLSNQAGGFASELESLHGEKKLLDVFEVALANFKQEITLKASIQESRIREVFATQLFPNLDVLTVPVGVIHQESHHANHADMVYVCGMAKAACCAAVFSKPSGRPHAEGLLSRGRTFFTAITQRLRNPAPDLSNAKRIFEFGTYRGQTTCGLAAVCKDAQIFTLNLPPEEDPRYAPYIGMFIAQSPDRERITQIFCNSRSFDVTPYRESMDYIFIDGDHSYEGVKNDTEKAIAMLKPGGVIVWHDYAAKTPGVLEYLKEFSQERPLFRLRKTCLAVYVDGLNPETAVLPPMDATLEAEEYENV